MRRIRLAAALALAVVTAHAPWPSGATSEGPPGCGADPAIPLVVLNCDTSGIELTSGESGSLLGRPWLREPSGVYYPGSRGVVLQGATSGQLLHPLQGQPFQNELAAISWNLLLLATALDQGAAIPEGCTLAQPELCSGLGDFAPLPDDFDRRAGGSGRFGRRDFDAAVPEPGAALLFAAGFALVARRLRTPRA
jgi:hypothetical protein